MDEYTRRPQNPRRRRKSKWDIIKEAYLPTIILIVTVILIIVFIAGALARRPDPSETTPPTATTTEPTADPHEAEAQSLLAQAADLAADYDYTGAIAVLDTFTGDISSYPVLTAKRDEYLTADANMVGWSASQVKALSFHTLIADAQRAFSNKAYGASYKKNFVTTGEFQTILQQLYDNGYVLVSLDDFTAQTQTDAADSTLVSLQEKELRLPIGKQPLLLVQTNVNYYTYMIDGDGDGAADKDGAGFASKLTADDSGSITCEMVDAQGNTVTGNYDLVPILEDFIAGHEDFSYRGARAILAPSGYDGIFGYRINASVKASKGEDYYNSQVDGAAKLIAALREKGYTLACYTYENIPYGGISAGEIQTDLRAWTAEITPVFGQTDILVFAQNSQLSEYTGAKFNVLYNAGFRYFLGFDTATIVGSNYLLQGRTLVSGSLMTDLPAQYNGLFDPQSVLDPLRGG